MLKQHFIVAVTAIVFLIKPTAITGFDSEEAVSSSASTSRRSPSCKGKEPNCGKNEVASDCIQGGCQAKTCSDLDRDIPCKKIDPKYCIKGCLCKDGYLRAENGTCVPTSSCTFNCTRSNEVFASCPPTCPPQTCESIDQRYNCPLIPVPTNTTNCRPACRCKTGYYRNKINECISKDNCLKCTGPNEYFSCGGACDNVCATLSEKNQTHCDIVNIVCNQMCYCEKGYARAKNNTCIPINKCTEPQCPVNEKYVQSPSLSCTPQTCSQLGFPLNCTGATGVSKCPEKPGCICIDGYVRNSKGVCIPKNNCSSCGGDSNAQSGCGINCNRHCSNIGKETQFCIELCKNNACDCKPGYFLDDNTGKCVLPADCTPTCGNNEVYNDCIQGQCQAKNCTDLGKSLSCPRIDPKYCIKGCLCKDGYLRAKNGTCIPEEDCGSCGGDRNATSGCGLNCNKQCSSIGVKGICPRIACPPNGCECKDGYYFNSDIKKCVLPNDCEQSSTTTSTTPMPTTAAPSSNITTELAEFRRGNLALSGELLYQSVQSNPGTSFVASPLSMEIPFAEICLYASGLALEQLLTFLNLSSKDQIRDVIPAILKRFQNQSSVTFEIANKFYANENYPLTDTFKNDAQTLFNSEGQNIDFDNPDAAADTINEWVANKTNDLIQNLVSPDMLSPDTRIVLVNAIYYLGSWSSQFNPNNTENRDFYITPNTTKSLPTMYQQGRFNYAEDSTLDAKILQLYYKGGNFSFVIWLPNTKDGLSSMVEKLRNPHTFSNSMDALSPETVQAHIPKFEIEHTIDLIDKLKKYNVTEVFNPYNAGLTGIVQNNDTVYISSAVQKARIKVDETGTEAAAATAITVTTLSIQIPPPEIQIFKADHPFVFCIKYQTILVFCGLYYG